MQLIKQLGLVALAVLGFALATAPAHAAPRASGSFEFFINASGSFNYMEIDGIPDGDSSFGGNVIIGFDIATTDGGIAIGIEGGAEYLGLMDFDSTLDFEVSGLPIGLRGSMPLSDDGGMRLTGSIGTIFWQTEITGPLSFCGPGGCGTAYFDQTERGRGVYLRGGFEFDIAGPLHAGVDLRYFQLAEDAALISPQVRLGLHF